MPTSASIFPASSVPYITGRTAWWLWPNLLSLDAPVIASLWQNLAAKDTGVSLSLASRIALPLAVWIIYLADRLLDAMTDGSVQFPPATLTARHAFYRSHRLTGLILLVLASGSLAFVLRFLPAAVLRGGLLLSALVAAYMLTVHALPVGVRRYFSKEAVVALLFSAGTTLSVWTRAPHPISLLFPALLFALLCWLNCSAIENWELMRTAAPPPIPQTVFPTARLTSVALGVVLVSAALFPFASCHLLLAAIVLSSLAFCWLDRVQLSLGADAMRVLTDIPLVVPLLLLLVLP